MEWERSWEDARIPLVVTGLWAVVVPLRWLASGGVASGAPQPPAAARRASHNRSRPILRTGDAVAHVRGSC